MKKEQKVTTHDQSESVSPHHQRRNPQLNLLVGDFGLDCHGRVHRIGWRPRFADRWNGPRGRHTSHGGYPVMCCASELRSAYFFYKIWLVCLDHNSVSLPSGDECSSEFVHNYRGPH